MLMVITTIYQNLLYCSFKFFIKFSHLFLKKPLKDGYYYLHFTDDEKETQNLRNLPKVVSQRRYKVEFVYSKSQLLISMLRCFFLYSSCLDLNSFFPFYIRGTSFNDLFQVYFKLPLWRFFLKCSSSLHVTSPPPIILFPFTIRSQRCHYLHLLSESPEILFQPYTTLLKPQLKDYQKLSNC